MVGDGFGCGVRQETERREERKRRGWWEERGERGEFLRRHRRLHAEALGLLASTMISMVSPARSDQPSPTIYGHAVMLKMWLGKRLAGDC